MPEIPVPRAPFQACDLPPSTAQIQDLRPAGVLAPYLGPRYSLEELRQRENYDDNDDAAWLPRIRAFPIPDLIGARVTFYRDGELAAAIENLLLEKLPAFAWETNAISVNPLRKYQIMHACLPAPVDSATGQPMCLELFGAIISIDGIVLDSEEGSQWYHQQNMRLIAAHRTRQPLLPELEGEIVLAIETATYSNLHLLGLGVPVYL